MIWNEKNEARAAAEAADAAEAALLEARADSRAGLRSRISGCIAKQNLWPYWPVLGETGQYRPFCFTIVLACFFNQQNPRLCCSGSIAGWTASICQFVLCCQVLSGTGGAGRRAAAAGRRRGRGGDGAQVRRRRTFVFLNQFLYI